MAKIKFELGFTFVPVLIGSAVLVILTAIIVLVINPNEKFREKRDEIRLQDIEKLSTSVNILLKENKGASQFVLCFETRVPCKGESADSNAAASSGIGWIKVNFNQNESLGIQSLPLDPANKMDLLFSYYSEGTFYELNTKLESKKYQEKMQSDDGDNDQRYELGTSLKLIH
jgi:hypothetical protein